jgi:membrane complex biogenesis BtpA family protein
MSLEERFGTAKPVIAMVHFPGLPGRPRHDRDAGRDRLLDVVGRDLEVLQEAGVDAVLFCNEADIPYQLAVGPEIPAAMAAVIGELHPSIRVPFGVNVLWDPRASLAVARATGAVFIREVLTGVYESDMGLIAPSLGDLAAYRDAIGASDVALFGNITPEFSSTIGTRTVAERARSASFLGLDVILISGPEAGVPFAMSDLRAAKQAAPQTPVLANTGVTADRLAETLAVADGVIVGTSLKVDGITWNPVDPTRARRFMDTARVLIDTEPVWRAAQSAVFAGFGVTLSERDLLDSTGQPIEELIPVWRRRSAVGAGAAERADAGLTDAAIAGLIVDRVIAHVTAEGRPMPGVTAAIVLFERCGLRLAIASSSPLRLIDAVCDRLGLTRITVRCSAMDEARGKPAPDVYLTAARRLGVAAASCLALEDSPAGIASAGSAGMRCIAVPDPLLAADPRYREADLVLESLTALDEAALRRLGVPVPG